MVLFVIKRAPHISHFTMARSMQWAFEEMILIFSPLSCLKLRRRPKTRNSVMEKSLFEFEPFADNREINVFVETAKGSGSKFKYEPELGLFSLHKSLPKGMEFPYDYGFIPSTLGEDGDPLDVLVLVDTDVFPGCLVKARLIGVIEAKQKDKEKEERNDRLIAVHARSTTWADISELHQLPSGLLDQIEHFFISYHDLHAMEFRPINRKGSKHAEKLIQKGIKRFQKSKSSPTASEKQSK